MTGASILFRLNAFNCNYSSIKIPNENAKICESLANLTLTKLKTFQFSKMACQYLNFIAQK